MNWLAIFDASSGALREVTCSDPASIDMTGLANVAIDGPPGTGFVWDATAHAFVADLAGARLRRDGEADTYRAQRVAAGCSTGFGVVQSDDVSRTNILGSVQMAILAKQAAAPFSMQWRMNDNTIATFDADQMIQVGMEVGEFVNACYQASFAVKAAIEAASTVAAIEAVDVTAGYPA